MRTPLYQMLVYNRMYSYKVSLISMALVYSNTPAYYKTSLYSTALRMRSKLVVDRRDNYSQHDATSVQGTNAQKDT